MRSKCCSAITFVFLSASLIVSVRPATAVLIGVSPGTPRYSYDSTDSHVDYTAATHAFHMTARNQLFVQPPNRVVSGGAAARVELNILVANDGSLLGHNPSGDDLVVTGTVTISPNTYTGILLTGSVKAFGYKDNDADGFTSDEYDFIFEATGGTMASFFNGNDIGVNLTSENSTFHAVTGFTVDSEGLVAKGNVGTVPCKRPLSGTVTCLSSGEKLNGVNVQLSGTSTGNTATVNGAYSFSDLAPGSYTVSISNIPAGYESCGPTTQDVTVVCGQNPTVNFCVCPCKPGNITGTVTCNSTDPEIPAGPIGGVDIKVYNASSAVVGSTTTAPDGTYTVTGLGLGSYTVKVTAVPADHESCDSGEVDNVTVACAKDGTANFCVCKKKHLPCVQPIKGKVTCPANNDEPIPGITVTLTNLADNSQIVKITDGSGEYDFGDKPEGNYTVSITNPDTDVYTICSLGGHTDTASVVVTCESVDKADFCLCRCHSFIRGIVTCKTIDAPLGGVIILLKDSGGNVIDQTTTASDGTYSFDDKPTGNYTVEVKPLKDVYELCDDTTKGSLSVTLDCDGSKGNDFCVCPCKGTISGVIICKRDNNAPQLVAGVTVHLTGPVSGDYVTTASGTYGFGDLPPGSYTVSVTAIPDGYEICDTIPASVELGCRDDATPNLCVCKCSGTVSGTIACADDQSPVGGATINLSGNGQSFPATTASDGSYSISGLPPGTYTVTVDPLSGYKLCSGLADAVVGCSKTVDYDVCMCPCGTAAIKGKIVCKKSGLPDAPIPGISVVISSNGQSLPAVTTAADGTYSVTGLAPGIYTVTVPNPPAGATVCSGSLTQTVELKCKEGDGIADFCLCLPCKGSISGTILCSKTNPPTPVKDVVVKIYKGSSTTALGTFTTDVDGTYTFGNLDLATYTVKIVSLPANTSLCYYTSSSRCVTISTCGDNKTADFCACTQVCDSATIKGKVVCSKGSNAPVVGAEVTISKTGFSTTAVTAADGSYSVTGLVPGTYTVKITKLPANTELCCDYSSGRCVKLCCGETEVVSFCACTKTCDAPSVSGKVVCSKTGAPVSGVEITISKSGYTKTVTTDSSGKYSVTGLTTGGYTIKLSKLPANTEVCCGGSTSKCITLSCGEKETADFCVCPKVCDPASVSGKVICSKTGAPIPGVEITISKSGFSKVVYTDSYGKYASGDLGTGSYTVKVTKLPANTELCCGSASSRCVTLSCGEKECADFCACPKTCLPGKISGAVGTYGCNSSLKANVVVTLYKSDGVTKVATTKTDAYGKYCFTNVAAGSYKVKISPPCGTKSCDTNPKCVTVDCADSDVLNFCLAQK